jgi:SAM-dependent methyltransferase
MANDDSSLIRRFFRTATPAWLKKRLLPFESELLSQATEFCREHRGCLILDVGCGRAAYEGRVFGLDLDFSNLDRENRVCGDALALPFVSGSFDFMLCNATLHHVENPERALVEMHRTLRPHGELLLMVPDQFPKTSQPDDYFRFDEKTISALLQNTGWTVVKCSPIGGRFWTMSRYSLEWLFSWSRGPQLAVFAIAAPVAGVLLPLACFYADSFAAYGDRPLGWAIRATKL